MPPPGISGSTCDAQGCDQPWASMLPCREIDWSLREAVFGDDAPEHVLAVCRDHLRKLRNKDGWILGYRYEGGKVRAYIREQRF